jgi:VanZ family protein
VESKEVIPATKSVFPHIQQKALWWALIIVWCGLIFYQSGKGAVESSKSSMFIVELLSRWAVALFGPGAFTVPEWAVRKTAHFSEYMILGTLLVAGFFNRSRVAKTALLSLAAGFLYAVSDEVHQIFVPGRTGRFTDVVIDTLGIALSVFIMWQALRRRQRGPR